ncbi:unnamed protein product [Alopecurus aequalis]
MAASRPPPSPPPTQSLSAGGGAAHISLFLDSDLGTHLALNAAAGSTFGGLKAQVAVEHAAAFPHIGPVLVKSFEVQRKGAMYRLCDSMLVKSVFSKVNAENFLHVNMTTAETDTRHCRDEDRGRSSDALPPMLKDDGAWVTVHAHDVHPQSSAQQNTERKSTTVCLATDVRTTEGVNVNSTSVTLVGKEAHTREENLLHSVEDLELGFISGDKQMVLRDEKLGELHAMDDLSEEKDCKKARVTGSFDTSAVDPVGETNDSKTRDVENLDKLPLETITNSHGVLSSTSCQGVDGNGKEDSLKLENSIITRKNKRRKKSQSVTSKGVCAEELTVEVPRATGEDLLHENQGLQGDGASNVEMTSRDKTKVTPPDMLLSSSQQNSGSQVTKHVQLGTDAQATSDLAADQSNINPVHEGYRNPIVGDISIPTCKVVAGEEKSAKGTNDSYHDESAVDASNMEKGSKREDVLETIDNTSQEKNCKQSKMVSSIGLTSMDAAEPKDQWGYGKKAGETDIISTQQEIVNDPYKQQITSNVQQGDCNVIESPNGDVKRKKKRRQDPEFSKDDRTQGAAKSSGLITNAVLTQSTSSHCLDANQITLANIGEETADDKDHCRREKADELFIVSTQEVSVHDPSNVQQGDSDVIKTPGGDGKRKRKKRRHLESSKDDPTQDVTKSSGVITNGSSIQNTCDDALNSEQTTTITIGEATVSECRKVDETVDVATTDVITEVLADSSSKVLNGDPLTEQTKGCASASLPPSAIQSDAPISSPSTKSNGKPVKILSTALGRSHSSGGLSDENACTELRESDSLRRSEKISDLKNVLTENTAVPADGRTKSTKRQRKKVSLKHAPTDSGKPIQSSGDQSRHVPAENLKGESNKADTQFQHAGGIELSDLPESHFHTDKTSLAHVGTGNVGMLSVSAQNMNRGDGNVNKGKRKSKQKSDLVKPESLKTYGGNQDTDNCPQGLMHSDVQKGRVEQGNAKENMDEVIIQNDSSMLQQETEDATRDSTLENKPHQSLSAAENLDKHPLEASTNSHGVLSSTSCQHGLDGNVKEHSIKPENPIITQKNKKRKKSKSVTSKGVCAQELTELPTGAVEVPKATGEDLLHENQRLQGDGASNVGMTSRDETNVMPPDMLLSSSQQNSGSQVTKHVQLGTDAQATSDPAAERIMREVYRNQLRATRLLGRNPDMFLQRDSFRNGPAEDH